MNKEKQLDYALNNAYKAKGQISFLANRGTICTKSMKKASKIIEVQREVEKKIDELTQLVTKEIEN